MITLPPSPTGADLVAAIRSHAAPTGQTPYRLALELSHRPTKWLTQTERVAAPRPELVEQVRKLLVETPAPPIKAKVRRQDSVERNAGKVAVALPPSPTGSQLVDAIRAHAAETGVAVSRLVLQLSPYPNKWLSQTECAAVPKPHTVERVRALLAGEPVPPPPSNNFQTPLASTADREALEAAERRAQAIRCSTIKHPIQLDRPRPTPVIAIDLDRRPRAASREPCPRCAVRGDIGCAHQLPFLPEVQVA